MNELHNWFTAEGALINEDSEAAAAYREPDATAEVIRANKSSFVKPSFTAWSQSAKDEEPDTARGYGASSRSNADAPREGGLFRIRRGLADESGACAKKH